MLFCLWSHALENLGEALALYLAEFVLKFFSFRGKLQTSDPAIGDIGRLFDVTLIDHVPQRSRKTLFGDHAGLLKIASRNIVQTLNIALRFEAEIEL